MNLYFSLHLVRMLTAAGNANSVDPDQTAPEEQSDQGLYWLLRLSVLIFRVKQGDMYLYHFEQLLL